MRSVSAMNIVVILMHAHRNKTFTEFSIYPA